jgi:hypothetical protein
VITAALEKVMQADAVFFGSANKSKLFIALKRLQKESEDESI